MVFIRIVRFSDSIIKDQGTRQMYQKNGFKDLCLYSTFNKTGTYLDGRKVI